MWGEGVEGLAYGGGDLHFLVEYGQYKFLERCRDIQFFF